MTRIPITCIALALLLIAGCGAPSTPAPTLPPGERPTPTPLPEVEGWTQAAEPVTLDNIQRLQQLGRLEAPQPPSTAFTHALSPDQTQLAALNNDLVVGWELVEGEMLFAASRFDANRIYFSPDKDEIYTLDSEGVIRILNAEDGTNEDTLRAHDAYNNVAAYTDFAGILALGGENGAIRVWDLFERVARVTLRDEQPLTITGIAITEDASRIAAADNGGRVLVWDWEAREVVAQFTVDAFTNSLIFSPDGRYLVVNNINGMTAWDATSGDLLHTLDSGFSSEVLEFLPDSAYLVADGGTADLTIYDVSTGELAAVLSEVTGDRRSIAVSPNAELLFASGMRAGASLWNLSNLADGSIARSTFTLDNTNIFDMAWTDDGFQVLVFDARGPVEVWGVAGE